MGTVTGLTAERMQAIEAASVVDGAVVGDNLILTRFDASTIDAGNVRGPTGSPGITGGELAAEMAAAFLLNAPICSIIETLESTAPNELWLTMVGQTIVDGETLYPIFWSKIPAAMKSGSNIIMPNTQGRVSVGLDPADADFNAINKTGGSKVPQLPTHTHTGPSHFHAQPAHTHDLSNHQHTAPSHTHALSSGTTDASGVHNHAAVNGDGSAQFVVGSGTKFATEVEHVNSTGRWIIAAASAVPSLSNTGTDGSIHAHNLSGSTTAGTSVQNTTAITNNTSGAGGNQNTDPAGTGNTGPAGVTPTSAANVPPYITFLKIIKVA